jgi:MinD-like ATPase involved in chromosome partitioning or flagellar assembly
VPRREDGSDGHDHPSWIGNGTPGHADPPPAGEPISPPSAAEESLEPRGLWEESDRRRLEHEYLAIDPVGLEAPKSANVPDDRAATVESSSAPSEDDHRRHGPELDYGNGHFTRQDQPTAYLGSLDVGQTGAEVTGQTSRPRAQYRSDTVPGVEPAEDIPEPTPDGWADASLWSGPPDADDTDSARGDPHEGWQDSRVTGKSAEFTTRSPKPSGRRMSLPPWAIPISTMPAEFTQMTSDAGEPLTGGPVATPERDAPAEPLPRPQGYGLSPPDAPLPPPPPPPGWAPGTVMLPAWWQAPPGWPPAPPGAPALPGWQGPWAGREDSLPAHPHPPASPSVHQVPTFRSPPSLDDAKVVDPRRYAPRSGWRRAVHRATRGHVNLGDSPKDRAHEDLLTQIRQPIAGDFRIAVLSIKGGVGKTTTTLGLGSALAIVRPDRVIAMDANPDRGTLAERVRDMSTTSTVRDLLTDPNINRYADVRGHTRMAVSRLEVLASEQDPAAADIFNEADYRRTISILGQFYNVILTDCGTGIMHSAMDGVLDLAQSIVLVTAPAIDAVRSAAATLDWLMQHGHSGLVRQGHMVLSAVRPGSAALKLDKVYEFFEARCRSIHFVPFDPHLAEGADVDFAMLKPTTRQAYLELAGAVVENLPRLHG